MSAHRVILLPIFDDLSIAAALSFGRRTAVTREAILQLLYLSEHEETPDALITRLGLAGQDLFNAMISIVQCQPRDYQKVILTAAARPEVELIILPLAIVAVTKDPQFIAGILSQAAAPVVLSRDETGDIETPIQQLLVPLDGSPSSASAIEPALKFAAETGAQLHVLHIANAHKRADEPGSLPLGTYMDQPHYEWPIWIREFWDRFLVSVKDRAPHIRPKLHVVSGDAGGDIGDEIVRFAQTLNCDLITLAVGTNAELVNSLMQRLSCPILLVRQQDDYQTKSAGI